MWSEWPACNSVSARWFHVWDVLMLILDTVIRLTCLHWYNMWRASQDSSPATCLQRPRFFSEHASRGRLSVRRSASECIKQMAGQLFLWVCKEPLYRWPAWLISHYVGSSRTSPGSEGGECDDLWFRYYRVSPGSIWRKRSGGRRQTVHGQELDTHAPCSSFLLGLPLTDGRHRKLWKRMPVVSLKTTVFQHQESCIRIAEIEFSLLFGTSEVSVCVELIPWAHLRLPELVTLLEWWLLPLEQVAR